MTRFLKQETSTIKEKNDPRPVMLAHSVETGNVGVVRAFQDGILLYDPINKRVIVSVDGAWRALAWADEVNP